MKLGVVGGGGDAGRLFPPVNSGGLIEAPRRGVPVTAG